MGKQVYIKIDPFMVPQLFKDHPNIFYTKNGLLVDLSTELEFKNYIMQGSLTPYMIVDEDEAIRNRYPIMDNPEHPSSVRIGQDPLRLIVYDNYIRNLMRLYPNIKSEADARALHTALTRYNLNVNDFYNYNYKRGANDTADELWRSLVADLRFILEKMGKNPADADAMVRRTLAGFDEAVADAANNGRTDKTLPKGYTIKYNHVPYYDGHTNVPTVYNHMDRPIYLLKLEHPDPYNNFLNNTIFTGLTLGAGAANGAFGGAYDTAVKGTNLLSKAITPSSYFSKGTLLGNTLGSRAATAGLWTDYAITSGLAAYSTNLFMKNPNLENGLRMGVSFLPIIKPASEFINLLSHYRPYVPIRSNYYYRVGENLGKYAAENGAIRGGQVKPDTPFFLKGEIYSTDARNYWSAPKNTWSGLSWRTVREDVIVNKGKGNYEWTPVDYNGNIPDKGKIRTIFNEDGSVRSMWNGNTSITEGEVTPLVNGKPGLANPADFDLYLPIIIKNPLRIKNRAGQIKDLNIGWWKNR